MSNDSNLKSHLNGTSTTPMPEVANARIEEIKAKYPQPRSAIMPALYLAQEVYGSITPEAVRWVSDRIGVPPVQVMEVASFYTMYYKKPVGRYHVQICRTLSCALCGARSLSEHMNKRFKILPGEITTDGMWSFEEVECLGSCGTAPMCEINDVYFENLTIEKFDQVLNKIEAEKPDLRLSTLRDELGAGLKGRPKSEVI